MSRIWAILVLLLASCSDGGAESPAPDREQIERLATPKVDESAKESLDTARLRPIEAPQVAEAGLAGPGCAFRNGEDLLVATGGSDAIARIGDETVHLVHSAPVGPSGAFLEDRSISISIGRRTDVDIGDQVSSWPARATVTNRRTQVQTKIDGLWTCAT